jgi:hypothetical protein
MRLPLMIAESSTFDLTGWATVALAIVGVVGVIAAVGVAVYAARVHARLKISATVDKANIVKVEITNKGKEAVQVHQVDFAARGWWGARLLRRLLFSGPFEPVLSSETADPQGVVEIPPGPSCEWQIGIPTLSNWHQPPTLFHPLTKRKGTISERRLVLRVHRGQNDRVRYLWYKRYLPIRRIKRVAHEMAG